MITTLENAFSVKQTEKKTVIVLNKNSSVLYQKSPLIDNPYQLLDKLGWKLIDTAESDTCLLWLCRGEPHQSTEVNTMPGRDALSILEKQEHIDVVTIGLHWAQWSIKTRYCRSCGTLLQNIVGQIHKFCNTCDAVEFVHIQPAVIAMVTRGNEVLLSRSAHFPAGVYSLIAGFPEVGESAEQAVAREVFEETNIKLKSIDYVRTQAWPFPDRLMLGFHCGYASGEIILNDQELEDAQWFNVNQLPELPNKRSVAYELLQGWAKKECKSKLDL